MKKSIIIISALLVMCSFTGCNSKKENNRDNNDIVNEEKIDTKELLTKVMNSEEKFITENNSEVLLKDFKITDNIFAKVKEYVFVDLDKDNVDELVINTESDYGAYIILRYENGKVYGYLIGIRSFESLKIDGSFLGSNSAFSAQYSTISFDKNTYNIKIEAINDTENKIYKIDNVDVTQTEINEYVTNWNKKENVKWILYNN